MDWNDLRVILAIGRSGSLSGAARILGLNHSTVFRRINAIEQRLDVRLFDRLPSGYVPTEPGEAALRSAEHIDEEINGLSRELLGADLRLQGSIRITAPEGLSLLLLMPLLADFCSEHPGIQIDLASTGSALQLSRREADLAVRVTGRPPDTTIGRRVCGFRFGLYASPTYLSRAGQCDLAEHDWILTDDSRDWFPQQTWNRLGPQQAKVVFNSNSILAALNAAKLHMGIAPLPCFLGDGEPGLVRVETPGEDLSLELWLLTHPDLRHTARIKALMAYLLEALQSQAALFEGQAVQA